MNSLVALCQLQLNEQPDSGAIFVFTNCRKDTVKLLVDDGQGFGLLWKVTFKPYEFSSTVD